MDLKAYYKRIREIAAAIPGEYAVVVSRATPDGGRAGHFTEVPREVAARMVADGIAELASENEVSRFVEEAQMRQAEEERRRAAARIQVNLITEEQARALATRPTSRVKRERSESHG